LLFILSAGLVVGALIAALLIPRTSPAAQAAPAAPAFSLPLATTTHQSLSLSAYRGHAVLLNFFSAMCIPCLQELPMLRQTAQAYKADGVVVLGIDSGGDTAVAAQEFARTARLNFPVAADPHESVAWQYDVGAWPTTFFIDANGRVHGQSIGPLDQQTVRDGFAAAGAITCADCDPLPPPDFAATAGSSPGGPSLQGGAVYTPPRQTPAFALRDQNGALITPAAFRGKVVALTFLSATCIQQCPLVGATLTQVRQLLNQQDAGHFVILAISVNPEQDSPAAIQHFAALANWGKDVDWHYLSGPRAILSRLWNAYGVYVAPPSPIFKQNQNLVHEAGVFLLDPQGRIRVYDDAPFLASNLAADVRVLL
jgi:cytochrome oxidase Cu insertion factor (SCO1/SenC/PrrC family)